jgi:hypothetical protein
MVSGGAAGPCTAGKGAGWIRKPIHPRAINAAIMLTATNTQFNGFPRTITGRASVMGILAML